MSSTTVRYSDYANQSSTVPCPANGMHGIVVRADNITLDLRGFFVIGNYDRGAGGEFGFLREAEAAVLLGDHEPEQAHLAHLVEAKEFGYLLRSERRKEL